MQPKRNNLSRDSSKKSSRIAIFLVILLWFSAIGLVAFNRTAIEDFIKLAGYQAPADIQALASGASMTGKAEHLFYLNKPQLENKASFSKVCPVDEQTIVIGCYHGGQAGIYVLDVSDKRLEGIEQVTSAHEMLHAAYERLSSDEKQKIDQQLTDYYKNNLKNQRIKDTIDAYKKIEPNDVVNEMHSIFGTEIANLPPALEEYYSRYFKDRKAVVALAEDYQSEFTTRKNAVANYDAQLESLKNRIDGNKARLDRQGQYLAALKSRMDGQKAAGQIDAYNANVPDYNEAVGDYNSLAATTRQLIGDYNDIVGKRNAVAFEERQLVEAISSVISAPAHSQN